MRLKVLLVTCLWAAGSVWAAPDDGHYEDLYLQANEAYKAGRYDSAKSLYSEVLNNGYVSADLYYNLGNAHFKDDNMPAAILYLERAKRLKPADEDILYNLEVANSFVTDKIERVEPFFIAHWWSGLALAFSPTVWAWMFIGVLFVFALLFTMFITSRHRHLRQLGFLSGLITLVVAIAVLMLGSHAESMVEREEAIVFSPTVNVKSEPSLNATVQFVIHEGLKVEVENTEGDWVRIKLADGNSGWIPSQSIERI